MAYCKNCNAQIDDGALVCSHCGAAQDQPEQNTTTQNSSATNGPSYAPVNTKPGADNGGFGWGLLGCCVPIAGLILFLVWKDSKPKTAKAAGIGALVSVIASVVIWVVYFVIIMAVGASYGMMY